MRAKWLAGRPLLMLFDRATANDPATGAYLNADGDAYPLQQRNAVTSTGTLSTLTPGRKNFPSDRAFNAVCLTIGQLTESSAFADPAATPPVTASTIFAQPRPKHEPDSAAPDPPAGNDPSEVVIASQAVRRYCQNNMEPTTATRLYVPIPAREVLLAHTTGAQLAGRQDWWKANLTPQQNDTIFQHIDDFVSICLTDPAITPFIAGFFVLDEPDIPRRLPREAPEVVGLLAGKVAANEECAFRVVSTNRPTEWSWQFFLDGVEVTAAGGTVSFGGTFEPIVLFPAAGRAMVLVRVGNWWGVSQEYQFRFDVVEDAGSPATPVITGLYSRTTDGVVRGMALTKTDDDPPETVTLEWTPAGSVFGAVGQDGTLGFCAVHASTQVISTFSVPPSVGTFHDASWFVPTASPADVSPLNTSLTESVRFNFPAYDGNLDDPAGMVTKGGCNLTLKHPEGTIEQDFQLLIQRQRVNPFPSWIRPGLIQRVADRLHSKAAAWWMGERPIRIFLNYNGGIIEERFRMETQVAAGSLKLTSAANFDRTAKLSRFGTRSLHENDGVKLNPAEPSQAAQIDELITEYTADFPPGTPPATAFRLRRNFEVNRQVLYAIDDYPIHGSREELLAGFKRSVNDLSMSDVQAEQVVRGQIHVSDVNQSNHNYGRFRADIARRKPGEGGASIEQRRSIAWIQMWGSPQRHAGPNSLSYSLGSFTELPRDPQSPARDDGWFLRKPNEFEARMQAWLPIFMGAEGIGWFAQFFCADALIFLLYNKIAAEIARYEDFRHNSWLLSATDGATEVNGRGILHWRDATLTTPRLDAGGNSRELVKFVPELPAEPEGRVELPLLVLLVERRVALTTPTRPAGKQVLFLANPSWRTRRVGLNLAEVAKTNPSGEGWQLYQYGQTVSSLTGITLPKPLQSSDPSDSAFQFSMSTESTDIILPLLSNEVRIYEREVLS